MSFASSYPSSVRVLQIPELAFIIFEIIGKHNAARLGRTCQGVFRSLMPLVWEHVSCATQVFNLICDTHVDLDSKAQKQTIVSTATAV